MGIRSGTSATHFPSVKFSPDSPVEDEDFVDPAGRAPVRLAGAGAALGGCFSVMVVVVALGSAAAVSEPREVRADIHARAAAAPTAEDPIVGRDGAGHGPAQSAGADDPRTLLTIEQRLELEAIERRVWEARASLDDARMRLTLSIASRRRQAVFDADSARQRAEQAHVHAAQMPWIAPDDFAAATRRRALDRIRSEADTAAAFEAEARAELGRRRRQVVMAEDALTRWLDAHESGAGEENPSSSRAALDALSPPNGGSALSASLHEGMRGRIARHRDRLLEK